MKYSRIAWTVLPAILLLLAGCNGQEANNTSPSGPSAVTSTKAATVTMTIDAKEHLQADTLEVPVREGMKLAEALREAHGMTFELETYEGMGTLVKGINGLNNNQHEGHYWQFCLDGTYSDRGIDDLTLKSGQKVSWYYRAYGETPCKKIGE